MLNNLCSWCSVISPNLLMHIVSLNLHYYPWLACPLLHNTNNMSWLSAEIFWHNYCYPCCIMQSPVTNAFKTPCSHTVMVHLFNHGILPYLSNRSITMISPFLDLVVHTPEGAGRSDTVSICRALWGDVAWYLGHSFLPLAVLSRTYFRANWWLFFTGGDNRTVFWWALLQWLPVSRLFANQLLHCRMNVLLSIFRDTLELLHLSSVCINI